MSFEQINNPVNKHIKIGGVYGTNSHINNLGDDGGLINDL